MLTCLLIYGIYQKFSSLRKEKRLLQNKLFEHTLSSKTKVQPSATAKKSQNGFYLGFAYFDQDFLQYTVFVNEDETIREALQRENLLEFATSRSWYRVFTQYGIGVSISDFALLNEDFNWYLEYNCIYYTNGYKVKRRKH